MIPLPTTSGGFGVVLADPAYDFETWSRRGQGKSPSQHYGTMTVERICRLPVPDIAAKDSVLFLWIPFPHIFRAPEIIDYWGYRYSGLAWVWLKFNPITNEAPSAADWAVRGRIWNRACSPGVDNRRPGTVRLATCSTSISPTLPIFRQPLPARAASTAASLTRNTN